jgi:polyisoprenoid-binding protein YceI
MSGKWWKTQKMTNQPNVDLGAFVGTWKLIPELTSVSFHTRAAWVIRARGTLKPNQGTIEVESDGRVSGEIIIDPASIDTRLKMRDDHLRSADYFDVANHPTIAFSATEVRFAASGQFEVVGNLEAHGQSTPLSVLAEVDLAGESVTLSAEVVITKDMLGMKKVTPAKSWVTVLAHFDRTQS